MPVILTPHLDRVIRLAAVRGYEREERGRLERVGTYQTVRELRASPYSHTVLNEKMHAGLPLDAGEEHYAQSYERMAVPLERSAYMWRGVHTLSPAVEAAIRKGSGGKFQDSGFGSVSPDRAEAEGYASKDGNTYNTLFRLYMPGGTKLGPPDDDLDMRAQPTERVLPRGAQYTITGVGHGETEFGDPIRVVSAQVYRP